MLVYHRPLTILKGPNNAILAIVSMWFFQHEVAKTEPEAE